MVFLAFGFAVGVTVGQMGLPVFGSIAALTGAPVFGSVAVPSNSAVHRFADIAGKLSQRLEVVGWGGSVMVLSCAAGGVAGGCPKTGAVKSKALAMARPGVAVFMMKAPCQPSNGYVLIALRPFRVCWDAAAMKCPGAATA